MLFEPFSQTIELDKGSEVLISGLKSKLFLDGTPISDQQVESIATKLPSWLSLDESTAKISGTAPSDAASQDLTITAKDQYGDSAQLTIHLAFRSDVFADKVGQLNATIGESFSYVIPDQVLAQQNEKLSVDFASLLKYLQFDSSTNTISGTIQKDFLPQEVKCTLTAISADGTVTNTQAFDILVSSGATTAPSGNGTHDPHAGHSGGRLAGIIVGSIIGGICGILLLVTLAICLRRRKKNRSYLSPPLPRSPRKSDISRPMHIPLGWPDTVMDQEDDLEKGKEDLEPPLERTPEKPPKIDTKIPDCHRDSISFTDSNGDADTKILDLAESAAFNDFVFSTFGLKDGMTPSEHLHSSMKIPTELAKRESQKSASFRKHKRRITAVYQDQIHRSSGLPVNRRITGVGSVGPSRHTYSPTRTNTNFSASSSRRLLSTASCTTTRCTSTFSTAPSALAQPAAAPQRTAQVTTPTESRRSIRVVPASRRSRLADRRNWDEKRSSYIRKRASAQSPFYSAAGSRVSSSTYKSPLAFIESTKRNTIV